MAGLLFPFPVIYTGGVCPLLWRPLTGLYSFNVPPYQFDLAPFLGLLNDSCVGDLLRTGRTRLGQQRGTPPSSVLLLAAAAHASSTTAAQRMIVATVRAQTLVQRSPMPQWFKTRAMHGVCSLKYACAAAQSPGHPFFGREMYSGRCRPARASETSIRSPGGLAHGWCGG